MPTTLQLVLETSVICTVAVAFAFIEYFFVNVSVYTSASTATVPELFFASVPASLILDMVSVGISAGTNARKDAVPFEPFGAASTVFFVLDADAL